jgi:arylsulfatase A-like enzyme
MRQPWTPILLLALLAGACGAGAPPALGYEDLVASGRLAALPGVEAGAERLCADETRFAVAVPGGRELRLPLVLGAAPTLTVAACAPAAGSALVLILEGPGGLASELRLPMDGASWAERTLDLAALAGGPASLRLRVDAPEGEALLVSDLWLRHRRPDPPGAGAARPEAAAEPVPRRARGWGRPPDRILLISVDTLRADAALGPPAGSGPVSALAAFAARAETFDPHYAAASWTKPSHASLLTGLPVEAHGIELEGEVLLPEATTLAERFSAGGFATAGLVYDCLWLDPRFGFDRGFDEYRVARWDAGQAARATVSWIARHRREPFFYFLHLFTPHSDMERLPYEGRGVTRETVAARFGLEDYGCREGVCASSLLQAINAGLPPLAGEEEVLRFLYQRGVATTDRALGRLFADLDELGLLDDMLVVVTSDHGEAFFEHGQLLHTTVHEEVLRVPLFVHWPGGERAGERRSVPTASIDLAPTLLAAVGLEHEGLPGRDLAALAGDPGGRRALVAGTLYKAVIAPPWKAIFSIDRPVEPVLYHLGRDPGERHDLAARHPDVLLRLRDLGIAHVVASRELTRPKAEPERPVLTPEERRRLEALGYIE